MEYYSAIKRNELTNYEKMQRNVKYVVLSERSQSKKGVHTV